MVVMDLRALRAAATREGAGSVAIVTRAFLADVEKALRDPSNVKLLDGDDAPAPIAVA